MSYRRTETRQKADAAKVFCEFVGRERDALIEIEPHITINDYPDLEQYQSEIQEIADAKRALVSATVRYKSLIRQKLHKAYSDKREYEHL